MKKQTNQLVQELALTFPPIMHLFHHLAGQVSKLGDFSLAQYRVLMLVHHLGPMSVSDLKSRLNIAQSSASEMVDRLVRLKLLRRETSTVDHRVTLFRLSDSAAQLLEQRKADMHQVYQQLLQPLSMEEQEELVEAMKVIVRLTRKHQQPE
jgi:DNA-binding MarR family transcriptional regulator